MIFILRPACDVNKVKAKDLNFLSSTSNFLYTSYVTGGTKINSEWKISSIIIYVSVPVSARSKA